MDCGVVCVNNVNARAIATWCGGVEGIDVVGLRWVWWLQGPDSEQIKFLNIA